MGSSMERRWMDRWSRFYFFNSDVIAPREASFNCKNRTMCRASVYQSNNKTPPQLIIIISGRGQQPFPDMSLCHSLSSATGISLIFQWFYVFVNSG